MPGSSSRKRLKSGAKTRGQAQPSRIENAAQAPKAQIHQAAPARAMSQSSSADEREHEHGADGEGLERIRHEERGRRAIEAMARLDPERAPDVERKSRDRDHEHDECDRRDLARQARDAGRGHPGVQRGNAARQRQRDEERGAKDALDHREARLRDRVVGRTGVILGRDRGRKRRRHAIAVRAHGAHLAAEQPQLDGESAGDRDDEEERERMHGEGEGHSSLC